jgi:hypothetical protein
VGKQPIQTRNRVASQSTGSPELTARGRFAWMPYCREHCAYHVPGRNFTCQKKIQALSVRVDCQRLIEKITATVIHEKVRERLGLRNAWAPWAFCLSRRSGQSDRYIVKTSPVRRCLHRPEWTAKGWLRRSDQKDRHMINPCQISSTTCNCVINRLRRNNTLNENKLKIASVHHEIGMSMFFIDVFGRIRSEIQTLYLIIF